MQVEIIILKIVKSELIQSKIFPKIFHNLSFVETMMLLGVLTDAGNSSSFNSLPTEKNLCIIIYYSS